MPTIYILSNEHGEGVVEAKRDSSRMNVPLIHPNMKISIPITCG